MKLVREEVVLMFNKWKGGGKKNGKVFAKHKETCPASQYDTVSGFLTI